MCVCDTTQRESCEKNDVTSLPLLLLLIEVRGPDEFAADVS